MAAAVYIAFAIVGIVALAVVSAVVWTAFSLPKEKPMRLQKMNPRADQAVLMTAVD